MNRTRGNKGFSLGEVLIVVAIVAILLGVSFIAVERYQRSTTQLEMDGTAKEIYIAAQNHLMLADSQGLLADDSRYFGTPEDASDPDIYYFVVPRDASQANSVLSLMLPPSALDETVLSSTNSYIIRYRRSTASVLDVLYSAANSRYPHTFEGLNDGAAMKALVEACRDKAARRSYGTDKAVIGWYGGDDVTLPSLDDALDIQDFTVINGDKLYAVIPDPNHGNADACLSLTVRGARSGAVKVYPLVTGNGSTCDYLSGAGVTWDGTSSSFTVMLDDITGAGLHFGELFPDFIPGEDLKLTLEVSSKTKIMTLPPAVGPKTTNSLFASVSGTTAEITSFRHLENIDSNISDLDASASGANVTGAKQTADLVWQSFIGTGAGTASVYLYNDTAITAGTYYPVCAPTSFTYDGGIFSGTALRGAHSITGVLVECAGAADGGLFGSLSGGKVSNLELKNFTVSTEEGSAGALAGKLVNTEVTNVLARCTSAANYGSCSVASDSGAAGGLVGMMNGTSGSSLSKCAAVIPVRTGTTAGGLVGTTSGGSIANCYSAGFTANGQYNVSAGYNVTGATAGGLVGSATGSTAITASYSTCSVTGTAAAGAAGGFIGSAESTTTIKKSYATGLIGGSSATARGAFAGRWPYASGLGNDDRNHYYKIINETVTAMGATYLPAVPGESGDSCISALDKNAPTYQGFVGDPVDWVTAAPFDSLLSSYYRGRMPFPGQARLLGSAATTGYELVLVHYGDWPAPELRVLN